MEFVSPRTFGDHETNGFQQVEVLGDRLSGHPQAVFHRQPSAQLEQRLAIPVVQLVQNRPSRRRSQCFEDVTHLNMICK